MPVRNIFYENPIYFLIKWVSKFSLFTLFFPSNTITISLMNLFCTSCSWVDSSHSKSESRVRVESFGAVDSSRVVSFFVLDSSRVAENSDSSPSQWLDLLQHWMKQTVVVFWGKTKNYITLYLYGIEYCLCFGLSYIYKDKMEENTNYVP
jgi:hypothetical protein